MMHGARIHPSKAITATPAAISNDPNTRGAVPCSFRKTTPAMAPLTMVCGEAAGDARVACLLVGLGVRRLSMSPLSAARVTYALRACDSASLERLAVAALGSDAPQAVSDMIDEALRETVPELGPGPISV